MTSKAKIVQAVRIWIVIYPSLLLFNMLFGSHISHLPLFIRQLVLMVVLVPWMVFVGLPFVNRMHHILLKNGNP